MLLLAFHLRGVNLSVVNVLRSTWLYSLRYCSRLFALLSPQGFFGRPLRGRFSTVLLRRYFTMMLCTVDLGILSSCPMAPSDLPSFQRSTTRCRCTTSCSLVFWQAAVDPPAAPQATPPVAPAAAAAASVGADKRQTVVEARREEQDNVTITGPCGGFLFKLPSGSMRGLLRLVGGIRTSGCLCWVTGSQEGLNQNVPFRGKLWLF